MEPHVAVVPPGPPTGKPPPPPLIPEVFHFNPHKATSPQWFALVIGIVELTLVLVIFAAAFPRWRQCAEEDQGGIDRSEAALDSEQPQKVELGDGEQGAVWPPYWGVTIKQVKGLLAKCQSDERWSSGNNVYTLVKNYVDPMTRGTGLGYALLLNQEEPLEVNVMVSHAWAENAEEFVDALERSVHQDDVMFICFLSLYQCEDGAGPSIEEQLGPDASQSPFWRVLAHIQSRGYQEGCCHWRARRALQKVPMLCFLTASTLYFMPMVAAGCVPSFEGCIVSRFDQVQKDSAADIPPKVVHAVMNEAYDRDQWWIANDDTDPTGDYDQWGTFLMAAHLSIILAILSWIMLKQVRIYRGRMLVVPNREIDLYGRLWCVYEIFVASLLGVPVQLARTLASAGATSSIEAVCVKVEDTRRLQQEIEAHGEQYAGDPMKGYEQVDRAIRATTRSSRWGIWFPISSLSWPVLMCSMSAYRLSVTVNSWWRWITCAIIGWLIGYSAVFYVLYMTVRRQQGVLETVDIWQIVLKLLAGSVLLVPAAWLCMEFPKSEIVVVIGFVLVPLTVILVFAILGIASSILIAFLVRQFTSRWLYKQIIIKRMGKTLRATVPICVGALMLLSVVGATKPLTVSDFAAFYAGTVWFTSIFLLAVGVPAAWGSAMLDWGIRLQRWSSKDFNDVAYMADITDTSDSECLEDGADEEASSSSDERTNGSGSLVSWRVASGPS